MSIKLTHKRTSKELETALAVVKCLIGVANNQIKSEPEEERWQEELDNHVANSPKPGSILFKNELDNYPQEMQWKTQQVKVYPHVGVMWIFPALLTHMVYPYKTPGERVSVSGNITYVNRSEFPKHYF